MLTRMHRGPSEIVRWAHAKLNLVLDVRRRREDGYHELSSVMAEVTLADRITLRASSASRVVWENAPAPAGDLVAGALDAMRSLHPGRGAEVWVRKAIWAGAGLGGGSSDAAAVIAGLADLWGTGDDPATLALLARRLGADVPFFLRGGVQWARGVGDVLTALPPAALTVVLALPRVRVSTPEAFAAWDRAGGPSSPDRAERLAAALASGAGLAPELLGNDLEPAVARQWPQVAHLRAAMRARGLVPVMTGSGSALFAPVDPGEADRAVRALGDVAALAVAVQLGAPARGHPVPGPEDA